MKTRIVITMLLAATAILSGCATSGKYVPDQAFTNSAQAVSVPHPFEAGKTGAKYVTTFVTIMDPGLWIEVVDAKGVWPTVGMLPDGSMIKGYSYLLPNPNYWGDFLLETTFNNSIQELKKARFLNFNRDGGYGFQFDGSQIPEDQYDPKKFNNDERYKNQLFANFGETLSDLDSFWTAYLRLKGVVKFEESSVSPIWEVKVGSPEWEEYVIKLSKNMPEKTTLNNGEVRSSFHSPEKVEEMALENNRMTAGKRFAEKGAIISIGMVASAMSGGSATPLAAKVVSDVLVAGIDDDWKGYYARATTLRYALAPTFRTVCDIYKKMLAERNETITKQAEKIEYLERRKKK